MKRRRTEMPNSDYILRSDAVSAFCGNCEATEVCIQLGEPCEEVKQIKAIPAADVAEVVYCSECFYHYDDGDHKCKKLRIPCPDDSEFFCKYGKRNG